MKATASCMLLPCLTMNAVNVADVCQAVLVKA